MILRPAQPPLRCHKPVCGRLPSHRFRPAFPITRLLWSTLDTRPTVATQVSSTFGDKRRAAGLPGDVRLQAQAVTSGTARLLYLHVPLGGQLHNGRPVHFPQQHPTSPCSGREKRRQLPRAAGQSISPRGKPIPVLGIPQKPPLPPPFVRHFFLKTGPRGSDRTDRTAPAAPEGWFAP